MDIEENVWEVVDRIYFAQARDKWMAQGTQ
jgi:hypothetical protein